MAMQALPQLSAPYLWLWQASFWQNLPGGFEFKIESLVICLGRFDCLESALSCRECSPCRREVMNLSLLELLRLGLRDEPPIHPLEGQMAKRWVKQRLKRIFPRLASDPEALEKAYQELGLEAHEGAGKGGATVYEITLPRDRD
jgi:hypothetical protein